jgi:MbtH protein
MPAEHRLTGCLTGTSTVAYNIYEKVGSIGMEDQEDSTIYQVVINHEEQYSIWPASSEPPHGWISVGKIGPKKNCLDYINDVWADMRPLSLRLAMAADAKQKGG